MKITFYTDGASRGNPGRGGWGVYIEMEKDKIYTAKLSGGQKEATNNQMELTATIEALKYARKNLAKMLENDEVKIKIFTDSNYVKNGITTWIKNWEKNNWRTANKKPVLNKELWLELLDLKNLINKKLLENNFSEIKFEYVRGHAGIKGNEIADELATVAADEVAE
ncbi:MAG: ribonuclease HI [Candidatus Pacebacteria bacterium]|jgi:ribonuclease HI|nr:ribonuclease HI [Candidatus Paceibacterota bacterium]